MRHRLTIEERLRGIRKALASPRMPSVLRPGLQLYLGELKKQLRSGRRKKGRKRGRPIILVF